MTVQVGMLLFPALTQLDLTAPFEVLQRLPDAKIHLVWKNRSLVTSVSGLAIEPTMTMGDCPDLDVLFVPGGRGQIALTNDDEVLSFLAAKGRTAKYVTSVCTGSLLLGAAGLLDGYDATTHWAYMDFLTVFGARPVKKRVVVDRNRITGGGVTSGIDFALQVSAEIAGEDHARSVQLGLEYRPSPPFASGHPDEADPAVVSRMRASYALALDEERAAIDRWDARRAEALPPSPGATS